MFGQNATALPLAPPPRPGASMNLNNFYHKLEAKKSNNLNWCNITFFKGQTTKQRSHIFFLRSKNRTREVSFRRLVPKLGEKQPEVGKRISVPTLQIVTHGRCCRLWRKEKVREKNRQCQRKRMSERKTERKRETGGGTEKEKDNVRERKIEIE